MERKRIGLLSLQWMNNYGTIIQTYALQKSIEKFGYCPEYIAYIPQKRKGQTSLIRQFLIQFPGSVLQIAPFIQNRIRAHKLGLMKKQLSLRDEEFERFRKRNIMINGTTYSTAEQLIENPPIYDIYITGSDQIWSPNLSYSSEAYMLNFVRDNRQKNAYASSLGTVNISKEYQARLKTNLSSFHNISCREESGAAYLTELVGRNVTEVVDPTMLLEQNDLLSVAESKRVIDKKYILCYFLGTKREHRAFAAELSNKTGMPCYYIAHDSSEVGRANALWDVGPGEFISLIHNASYVCTDSFHGSVLSILFHRNVYGFCKRNDAEKASDNSRMYDLYSKFGIESRLNAMSSHIDLGAEINYSGVDEILELHRSVSIRFLRNILGEIE